MTAPWDDSWLEQAYEDQQAPDVEEDTWPDGEGE